MGRHPPAGVVETARMAERAVQVHHPAVVHSHPYHRHQQQQHHQPQQQRSRSFGSASRWMRHDVKEMDSNGVTTSVPNSETWRQHSRNVGFTCPSTLTRSQLPLKMAINGEHYPALQPSTSTTDHEFAPGMLVRDRSVINILEGASATSVTKDPTLAMDYRLSPVVEGKCDNHSITLIEESLLRRGASDTIANSFRVLEEKLSQPPRQTSTALASVAEDCLENDDDDGGEDDTKDTHEMEDNTGLSSSSSSSMIPRTIQNRSVPLDFCPYRDFYSTRRGESPHQPLRREDRELLRLVQMAKQHNLRRVYESGMKRQPCTAPVPVVQTVGTFYESNPILTTRPLRSPPPPPPLHAAQNHPLAVSQHLTATSTPTNSSFSPLSPRNSKHLFQKPPLAPANNNKPRKFRRPWGFRFQSHRCGKVANEALVVESQEHLESNVRIMI